MTSRRTSNSSVGKIAGLTIVNAMVFQEVLADYEAQVNHLRQTLQSSDVVSAFADHWDYIVNQINYHPIFHAAHQLLLGLPSNPDTEAAIRHLANAALDIVRQRAALRHDLMGRVYHKLLAEAKYLGTYYTSVPAATLLLKLALEPDRWPRDWGDIGELSELKIGDLACGTGTLLMAAAEAVTDNYLRACGAQRKRPNLEVLSRLLMEDIIYGYDVLLSALHLTASTLALRSPEVTFRQMHLWSLPYGGIQRKLGSIEFLRDSQVPITVDLFGASSTPEQVTGSGTAQRVATLPNLDLCVMNPPFTRSAQPNLLFGSLPERERVPLQKELAGLLRRRNVQASSTAGLAAVFVAVGDRHIKPGGRIALVLPRPLVSGVAWQKTRQLLQQNYQLEYLIVSHDPAQWNFSENTNLSEVLAIAKKNNGQKPNINDPAQVVCVNLWKNPQTATQALSIAYSLQGAQPPDLLRSQGSLEILMGNEKYGEVVAIPWSQVNVENWKFLCAFAQSDLLRAMQSLLTNCLSLPGNKDIYPLPLCSLNDLGTLGPDPRDVYDGFQITERPTPYPAFWGARADSVLTMQQTPNMHLYPLSRARPGRPLRLSTVLWPRAGKLLLTQRPRLNTKRLSSILLNNPVLSDVWWPITLNSRAEQTEKLLALWFNSTLGLLMLLGHREETQGAWVQFKKPVLSAMPVLDPRALSEQQKKALSEVYDRLCQQELLPFPQMAEDPVRAQIDAAISQALGLPDLAPLRELLAREPVVCLRPLY